MIDYDSFSRCHLTDFFFAWTFFFAFHAGAKELRALTERQCTLEKEVGYANVWGSVH